MKSARIIRSLQIVIVLSVGSVYASGCSQTPCEKLVDLSSKCAKDKSISGDEKKAIIALCEANKDTEDLKPELECAQKNEDCEGFDKCQKENRTRKAVAEIQEKMDEGDFSSAGITCSVYEEDAQDVPELVKACDELNKRAVRELTKGATDIRDGKSDKDYFDVCFDLEKFAEKLGEDKKKEAQQLCKEAKTAKDAKAAIDKSKENAEAGKHDLPFQCDMAIKDLETLGTDWANAKIKEVATACYVTLGAKILAAEVPDMSFCKYKVKQVYEAVRKHQLKDPSIDEWITKAEEKCKQ